MKISLHIEADSAEEFNAALEVITKRPVKWVHAVDVAKEMRIETPPPVEDEIAAQDREIAAFEPEPLVTEPVHEAPPAPEPAAEPVEEKKPRARRGRPAKAEPEPAPAPVAAEPKANGIAAVVEALQPVSRDDFNAACRDYVTTYGMNFAQTDAPKLLQPAFGDHIRRSIDVPDEHLGAATKLMADAVRNNPFKRPRING